MNKTKFLRLLQLTVLSIYLSGCEGDVGPAGLDSLISTEEEAAGVNCSNGGLKVNTGLDSNRNGILEASETKETQYLCSKNGLNSLVKTVTEPRGTNCTDGGLKVEIGLDLNSSGTLEEQEVQETRILCNGTNGSSVDQIRFQLMSLTALETSSTSATLAPAWQYLTKFDKKNFNAMSSTVLSAHIETRNASAPCIVDLFNLTDNVPVAGSEVTTSSTTRVWVDSRNFIEHLPNKEIDLAIRIRSSSDGVSVSVIQAHLILSKN